MCGILGSVSLTGKPLSFKRETFLHALEAIRHRGPDDHGASFSADDTVYLGHRRLSIIDLSAAGHQPMSDGSGSLEIIFNGEIYNYEVIKAELQKLGYSFKSRTDTEVILNGYHAFGPGIVPRLRGMFAFAIYDKRKNEVFIARDRLGIKPINYFFNGEVFVFCSEIKPLFETGIVPKKINKRGLVQYLSFGKVYSPETIFEGVRKFPAGHYCTVRRGDTRLDPVEYWTPYREDAGIDMNAGEEYFIRRTRELLEEAVSIRMLSDVPVGVFLSGGVDSTANLAFMSRRSPSINTFTIGFEGQPEYDERVYAEKAARLYNSTHREYMITRDDFMSHLGEVMNFLDEPVSDSTCLPIYFISRLARENNTIVILNGDGSDEMFCGYSKYQQYLKLSPVNGIIKRIPASVNNMFAAAARVFSQDVASDMFSRAARGVEMYIGRTGALKGNRGLMALADRYDIYRDPRDGYKTFLSLKKSSDYVEWLSYWGIKSEVEHIFLYRADRMGMAHSIEIRVPFLDHKLVEFAMQMPQGLKYRNGEKKYILKKALEGIVPDEFLYRKKQGFCVPVRQWSADLMIGTIERVFPAMLGEQGFEGREFANEIVAIAKSEKDPDLIWQLYSLSKWFETWF